MSGPQDDVGLQPLSALAGIDNNEGQCKWQSNIWSSIYSTPSFLKLEFFKAEVANLSRSIGLEPTVLYH